MKYKAVARGAKRLYCANPACGWYRRGIAVHRVRSQLLAVLQAAAKRMQEEVERSTATTDREKTKEQIQAENKLATLEQLRASGDLPGLDVAISALRDEIAAFAAPVVGPDWTGLAELLATLASLMPSLMPSFAPSAEYVAQIIYTGTPTEVEIRIRKGA